MHFPTTLTLALAGVLTITSAAPSFGTVGQQVVNGVEDARDYVGGRVEDALNWAKRPGQKMQEDGLPMHKYKDSKKHKAKEGKRHKQHKQRKALTGNKVRRKLKKADIIPEVIDDFVSSFLLNVTFPHNASPFLGHKISPSKVQQHPHITLYPPSKSPKTQSSNTTYPLNNLVIVMTDPDAPSRSNSEWGEICHWIAAGISLTNLTATGSEAAIHVELKHIMPYKPPGPPPKTGKHRYVLLAFTPINATSEPLDLVKPADRKHWGYGVKGEGVKRWAAEMGLTPIAGDYFKAKADK